MNDLYPGKRDRETESVQLFLIYFTVLEVKFSVIKPGKQFWTKRVFHGLNNTFAPTKGSRSKRQLS